MFIVNRDVSIEKYRYYVWFVYPNGSRSAVDSYDNALDALKETNRRNIEEPMNKYVMIREKII